MKSASLASIWGMGQWFVSVAAFTSRKSILVRYFDLEFF